MAISDFQDLKDTHQGMDPQKSAQDALRCSLCSASVPSMYCDICHINLCKGCVGEHIYDGSKDHKVVPFDKRGLNFKCPSHSTKICELQCEDCDIPVCILCVSIGEHLGHEVVEILKSLKKKKDKIHSDLQELENSIYSNYQEAVLNIPIKRADLKSYFKKQKTTLNKQGDALHSEIDSIMKKIQSELDDMECQYLAALDEQGDNMNHIINEITHIIEDMKRLLETSDICLVSKYKNRNKEFRRLPAQLEVILPTFTPYKIDSKQICQQFGSLSKLVITKETDGGSEESPDAKPIPPVKTFIDEPEVITDIKTEYEELCSVSCLNDTDFWTCGASKFLQLHNLQGNLLKSIQTDSGNWPHDIAVIENGDLAYTDPKDRSINVLSYSQKEWTLPLWRKGSKAQLQTKIKLHGWIPLYVSRTTLGDLLVIMDSYDRKQTKVVRYSGSTEKQSIQWDDQGQSFYSSGGTKYLCENRNLDICVADRDAGAVVVVSGAGKLRFRYTGPNSTSNEVFQPVGITTDSQARILTSDYNNHHPLIHIVDQDGQFLRYIVNCGLRIPVGLSLDSEDNLFVADVNTGKVTKIKYYQ